MGRMQSKEINSFHVYCKIPFKWRVSYIDISQMIYVTSKFSNYHYARIFKLWKSNLKKTKKTVH